MKDFVLPVSAAADQRVVKRLSVAWAAGNSAIALLAVVVATV